MRRPRHPASTEPDTAKAREGEARFRASFATAAVGLVTTGPDERLLDVNAAFCAITGYAEEELRVRTLTELVHPDERAEYMARVKRMLGGDTPAFVAELRYVRKDGETKCVRMSVSVMSGDGIAPCGMTALVEDITEHRRAVQALMRARDILAEVQEIAQLGSFEYDAATQKTVWSKEQYRIFGLDPSAPAPTYDELYARFLHPDDRAALHAAFTKAMQDRTVFETEHRIVRPDGTVRWVRARAKPFLDDRGKLVRYFGTSLDTTARREAEEKVRESERRFEQIASNIRDVFWVFDNRDKRLVYASPAYETVFGRSLAALYENPRQYVEAIHPDDRAVMFAALEKQERDEPTEMEYRVVHEDGTIRWIYDRSTPICDEQGRLLRTTGIATDVTAYKKQADEIIRARDFYLDLLEHAPALVWRAGPDAKCDWFNQSWLTFRGRSMPEELGDGWTEGVHPEDLDRCVSHYLASFQRRERFEMEYRLRHHSGEYRWIVDHGVPLRNLAEEFGGFIGYCYDITERKAAEEALRQSEERFRQMADNAREVFWLADASLSQMLYCSPAFENVWGRSCRELYEQPYLWFAAVHPDDRQRVWKAFSQIRTSGAGVQAEYRIVRPDGLTRWISDHAMPVMDAKGQIYRVAGIAADITERKQAEAALQLAQYRLAHLSRITAAGEVVASIAHEVNQPIAGVVSNGDAAIRWLSHQPPNIKETRAALHNIIQDANRAADVIRSIRSFLRKAPAPHEPLDINEVVGSVLLLVDLQLGRVGVAVQTRLQGDLPAVSGDRVQLQQVLLNIITNSIDAMSDISRQRKLFIETSSTDSESVLVQVLDTGAGLSEEQAQRVGEAFFTTKPAGLGMGLWISRSIVESHGGRLWLESTSPQGTEFRFALPLPATAYE